jgi:antirestriction protein ArdC
MNAFIENKSVRKDVYTRVTDKVVADLEAGVRPWLKPWTGGNADAITLPLRHCGTPYRGINILLLWGEAMAKGYASAKWMTYRQALEELVAELGSAFLCSALGITPEVREDHAAYLDHWLKVLKADKRAIFTAAAHAQRAVDFLHGLQKQEAAAA